MRLGRVLYRWRQVEDLSLRAAGKMMGLTATTLMRIEKGHEPDGRTLMKILNWLTAPTKASGALRRSSEAGEGGG